MTADRNARIEERAYHIWLEEGRPDGRHDEHWLRAEREMIEEERRLPVTVSRDGVAATGAPEASAGKTVPPRAESRQDSVAAAPADASPPRAKSQTPDHSKANPSKADQPTAKPRARSSGPAAAGSGSRGTRRLAAAKPAG
jgi:hypothetical protein